MYSLLSMAMFTEYPLASQGFTGVSSTWPTPVTTMSNSGSYLVALVASQYSSPTPVAHSYSGHGHADILPLSTNLGLIPTQSLLHLTVYPALT